MGGAHPGVQQPAASAPAQVRGGGQESEVQEQPMSEVERAVRDFVLTKAPELFTMGIDTLVPSEVEDMGQAIKSCANAAVSAVERCSAADKQRLFKTSHNLLAGKRLPAAFFMERHRFSGNIARNFLARLAALMDEAHPNRSDLKTKMSHVFFPDDGI